MEIFKNRNNLMLNCSKTEFSKVIITVLDFFQDDVIKIANDSDNTINIQINCIEEESIDNIINVFKKNKLFNNDIYMVDSINTLNLKDSLANKESYINIKNKRNFILYDMGYLSGLSPMDAICKYHEKAFFYLYANYENFDEYEKNFVSQAMIFFIRARFENIRSETMFEEDIKQVLINYQNVCSELIEKILKAECCSSLDGFFNIANLDMLRNAFDNLKEYLLNMVF